MATCTGEGNVLRKKVFVDRCGRGQRLRLYPLRRSSVSIARSSRAADVLLTWQEESCNAQSVHFYSSMLSPVRGTAQCFGKRTAAAGTATRSVGRDAGRMENEISRVSAPA